MWIEVSRFLRRIDKFTTWKRIDVNSLHDWIKSINTITDIYATIQKYHQPVKEVGELHECPFFVDFDCSDDVTIEDVLSDARKVVEHFLIGFEVEPHIWFSGNRGFHITVDREYFGAEPSSYLTYVWHTVVSSISSKLELKSTDFRTYTVGRMWRLSGSVHGKSGLYKIPLTVYELMNLDIDAIRELAKEPRDIDEEEVELSLNDGLAEVYKNALQSYEADNAKYSSTEDIEYDFGDDHPPCIQLLLKEGLTEISTKNRADMVMAGYCKSKGMSITEAIQFITTWARSIPESLTHVSSPEARASQSVRVVKTAYASDKYHFSCGSVKALGGIEELCKDCGVHEVKAKAIDLTEYSNSENMGHPIHTEGDVIGKDNRDLICPKSIFGYCIPDVDTKACSSCDMLDFFNTENARSEKRIVFNAKNKDTIELLDASTSYLHHRIKRLFGVADRCRNFKYEVEWGNAQTVYIASRMTDSFKVEDRINRLKAVHLDRNIILNRGYELEGYVWPNPRNLEATFLIQESSALESSLSNFILTDDEVKQLEVFKCSKGQLPIDKVHEIHQEFINNFLYVFGRDDLILAIDMVYHSARWINFQRQRIKGWLDILVLGDTRQGKTDVAKKLMSYYDLGTFAAGETCSRTGLLYTVHTTQGEDAWIAFGLLCRANGMLVIIDEIHGMPSDDFKEFTQCRAEGRVDVKRAAYGVAAAETRLISIANAKPGMQLSSYAYPIQAITEIPAFTALEDVSRFDYCVGVRAGDVSDSVINTDVRDIERIEPIYNRVLCRNLILWIWTRTEDQIHIEPDAETLILDVAQEMSQDYVPDIPLVESADIRHKILRLATAFAGRTFNSPDGINLVVTAEHVKAAYMMLDALYSDKGLNYKGFSEEHARAVIPRSEINKLLESFRMVFPDGQQASRFVLNMTMWQKTHLLSASNFDNRTCGDFITFLLTHRMIEFGYGGRYKKTPFGRKFLQAYLGLEEIGDKDVDGVVDDETEEVKEDDF